MRRRELKVSLGGSLGPAAFCTKGRGSSEASLCINSIDAVHIAPVSDTEWRDQPWEDDDPSHWQAAGAIDAGDRCNMHRIDTDYAE